MKVIWVSHSGGPAAGAELSMCEAVDCLREKGVAVEVVLPWRGELAQRFEQMSIPAHIFPVMKWAGHGPERQLRFRLGRARRNFQVLWRLTSYLRRSRPDVVVSNTLTVAAGALAARLAGVPHVWYVHELSGSQGHDLYFDWGERFSFWLMDLLSARIIANSQTVCDQLASRIHRRKVSVIYYAVEVEPSAETVRRDGHSFRLIQVGRVSPGKRQEDAVRAVALLVRKGLDVRLTLVGGELPEYGSRLRAQCEANGIADRVDFVPRVDDPYSYIADADCMIMCSRGEAFGRVTVEAMKLGRPVIGADSGGTSELIRDGVNGFLFRVGDATHLAEKIEILCRDRELLEKMGAEAQRWATDNFNRQLYGAQLFEVLRSELPTKGVVLMGR